MFKRFRRLFRRQQKLQTPIVINIIDEEYLVEFVLKWNIAYPVDRWYREKHKIAFNSLEHRVVSFSDMRFEFEESIMFNRNERLKEYAPNKGEWLDVSSLIDDDSNLTEAEKLAKYKKEFAEMNLDQYKQS